MTNYAGWIKSRLEGQDAHIVASGSSLLNFDYSTLDNKNVITTNHAYKKVKNPLWCVAVDTAFIQQEDERAPYNVTLLSRPRAPYPIIGFEFSDHFSLNPADGVFHKKSSGAAAICTVLQAGAAKVYLYGYDCYVTEYVHATDKEFRHRKKNVLQHAKIYERMIKHFEAFPTNNIINMNIKSSIPYFEKVKGY